MKPSKKRIGVADFERAWGEKLGSFVKNKVKKASLFYRELSLEERDAVMKKTIEFLLADFVVYAGAHRYEQWEKGWGENLGDFKRTKKLTAVSPRYFGKYPINRFEQRLILALDKGFEVGMLSILEYWLFDKYFRNAPAIYEFGCGTGHNLLRLREVNKQAELWGLDWTTASQAVIRGMAKTLGDKKLRGHRFDFFHPDRKFKLAPGSAVLTVASLEQTGRNYKKFVGYLLKSKPAICVHIEPIGELLDENVLVDYLSIKYFEKRNYLNGYLDYLRELEAAGVITIHEARRSYIGSMYIDGYSVIVWSPVL